MRRLEVSQRHLDGSGLRVDGRGVRPEHRSAEVPWRYLESRDRSLGTARASAKRNIPGPKRDTDPPARHKPVSREAAIFREEVRRLQVDGSVRRDDLSLFEPESLSVEKKDPCPDRNQAPVDSTYPDSGRSIDPPRRHKLARTRPPLISIRPIEIQDERSIHRPDASLFPPEHRSVVSERPYARTRQACPRRKIDLSRCPIPASRAIQTARSRGRELRERMGIS